MEYQKDGKAGAEHSEASLIKATNSDQAYEEVLRRLRAGEVGADDRIVDRALAEELNMSRMPVREALLRLVDKGYLIGTTRGFRLPDLSEADIMEIFDIRQMLEPRAAAMAAALGSGLDLEVLERALNDARDAWMRGDVPALANANRKFRATWLEAVPNARLVALISRFFDHVNAVRTATLSDQESQAESVTLSVALFEGFKRYDTLCVQEQMTRFIQGGRARFLAVVQRRDANKS